MQTVTISKESYDKMIVGLAMVALARKMVMKMSNGHARLEPFGMMYIKSLIISFIAAFFIILIVFFLCFYSSFDFGNCFSDHFGILVLFTKNLFPNLQRFVEILQSLFRVI